MSEYAEFCRTASRRGKYVLIQTILALSPQLVLTDMIRIFRQTAERAPLNNWLAVNTNFVYKLNIA
ncbi:hypothetical protein MPC4_10351 [Methylocella tundrae]|uniref:Uncharacterized protein n=1 Tax=Methylocella tundrae TaxID=227605 RepID=A0A8B6M045_METTU|nr:hypothetical protein MPC1_10005 [Methylocella tundrae]VTZ48401.1 hypothetical protein MPC4_10351 [Methylocella tundrae]